MRIYGPRGYFNKKSKTIPTLMSKIKSTVLTWKDMIRLYYHKNNLASSKDIFRLWMCIVNSQCLTDFFLII